VIGDFNDWEKGRNQLWSRGQSGIWQGVIEGVKPGAVYKYHIVSHHNDYQVDKADPYGFLHEMPPRTGSVVWDMAYTWNDQEWMAKRHRHNSINAPINIYEMHFGSWRKMPEDGNRSLSYREIAEPLAEHLKR